MMKRYRNEELSKQWWYDTLDNNDYGIVWRQQNAIVIEAALKKFVEEDQRCLFDFEQMRPRLDRYPPNFHEYHSTHIMPIARMIQPLPVGMTYHTTMLERYQMVASLIRNAKNALVDLEQLEFMREEIEEELENYLTWYSGQARGLSWVESFFGKPIPQPKSCAEMARRV